MKLDSNFGYGCKCWTGFWSISGVFSWSWARTGCWSGIWCVSLAWNSGDVFSEFYLTTWENGV